MLKTRKAERQWKQTLDEALSPEQLGQERDRLAGELARSVWVAHGGRPWVEAAQEGSLVALESLIAPVLDADAVRSSAALRYLAGLEETLRRSDYEDHRSLKRELGWAARELAPVLPSTEGASKTAGGFNPERFASAMERLQATMYRSLTAVLKDAEIAA